MFDGRSVPASAGDASIAFAAPTTDTSSDQPSIRVPAIVDVRAGDFLWLTMFVDTAGSTVTPPSGWTAFGDCKQTDRDYHAFAFYRVSDGTDPPTYEFAVTSTHLAETAALVRYRNVDAAQLPPQGSCDVLGTGSTFTAPALAAPPGGLVVVSFVDDVGCKPWTPASPLVARAASADGVVLVGDAPSAATSFVATCSASAGGGVVFRAVLHAK